MNWKDNARMEEVKKATLSKTAINPRPGQARTVVKSDFYSFC